MLWRFFNRIISTYIYSDLDDFFCTSSGGKDFSKSYWIKIFLFEFWFENNIGTNRKEGFIRFHDLYLHLSLMKQLMTISAITHLSRVKKNHRDFLVNIYPSFDKFLNHEKKIWVRLRHLWYTCIYSRQILRTNEKKRDGRGEGGREDYIVRSNPSMNDLIRDWIFIHVSDEKRSFIFVGQVIKQACKHLRKDSFEYSIWRKLTFPRGWNRRTRRSGSYPFYPFLPCLL